MRSKNTLKFNTFKHLVIIISLALSQPTLAEEGNSASDSQQNVQISSSAPTDSANIEASNPPSTNMESKLLSDKTKATMQLNKGSLKNPYALLVNLAFKGKNASGARDYTEAIGIYCKAARDGDANALYAMGWLYSSGRGVTQDEDTAALFYQKAAAKEHVSAKERLAESKGNPSLGVTPVCMLPDPVPAMVASAQPDDKPAQESTPFYTKGPIFKLVNKIAPKFNIEPDLAMAFIAVESGFNPQATSPKNAQGLMQLIPETAARFNVKDAYNPEENIKGGLAYLEWLLAYFKGDIQLVAAAYNSGELTVERYKGVPPYPETQNYVKKIASLYKKTYHPYREDMKQSSIVFNNLVADQPKSKNIKTYQ